MNLLDHLHPAVVHFPIALLLLGSVLALVQLYGWVRFDLRVTIWVLLGAGWLGGLAAVLSGLLAQANLPPDAPYRGVLNWHIGTGVALLVVYGVLLYQAWLGRPGRGSRAHDLLAEPRSRLWVTALLATGIVLIVATGWNGGLLVYRWAVNVQP